MIVRLLSGLEEWGHAAAWIDLGSISVPAKESVNRSAILTVAPKQLRVLTNDWYEDSGPRNIAN